MAKGETFQIAFSVYRLLIKVEKQTEIFGRYYTKEAIPFSPYFGNKSISVLFLEREIRLNNCHPGWQAKRRRNWCYFKYNSNSRTGSDSSFLFRCGSAKRTRWNDWFAFSITEFNFPPPLLPCPFISAILHHVRADFRYCCFLFVFIVKADKR